jgi:PAS domain S-box-containing protein
MRGKEFVFNPKNSLIIMKFSPHNTLKHDADWLESILNSCEDGVIAVNQDGKIIFSNPASREILGIETLDVPIAEWPERYGLFLPDKITRFPPERLPVARALRGESCSVEIFHRTKSMRCGKWIHAKGCPIFDKQGNIKGAAATFRDVTTYIDTINTFRSFLESAPDATIIVDTQGKIAHINRQVVKLFGYNAGELIGKEIEMLIPERFRSQHEIYRKHFEKDPHTRPMGAGLELYGKRKDGSEFPVDVSLGPVETPEGVFVATTIRDITDRKKTEAQVMALLRELERSNRDLQDFTFVASHDLQEPLRKIQAFCELLKIKCFARLDDQEKDLLERMLKEAHRMQELINDLLSLSRVTRKEQTFALVNLKEILEEVQSTLEMQIEDSGGKLEIGDLPVVAADPTQMRELFQNLIGNALKFRKEGIPPVVKVYAESKENMYSISVEDNGIGFDPKYAERIFGVFQRLHSKDEYEGTGIGLAICRKIVERHGGNIMAKGEPGKGSIFTVNLPANQAEKWYAGDLNPLKEGSFPISR